MATIGITGNTPIYTTGIQSALTLKNVGTELIWLDSQPNVTTNGFPLGVGSSIVWDAGRKLYAYAVTNGQLLTSENSGNLFDAQAVASEILSGGLAQAIAANIAISGAPPINKTELIYNSGNMTRPVGGGLPIVVGIDTSKYNSINVVFNFSPNSPFTPEVLGWQLGNGFNVKDVMAFCGMGGRTVVSMPVTDNTLFIQTISPNPTANSFEGSVTVYGSTVTIGRVTQSGFTEYVNPPVGSMKYDGSEISTYIVTLSDQTVGLKTVPIRYKSGEYIVTADTTGSSATAAIFLLRDHLTNKDIVSRITVTNGVETTAVWAVPDRPVLLAYSLPTGITECTLIFTPRQ